MSPQGFSVGTVRPLRTCLAAVVIIMLSACTTTTINPEEALVAVPYSVSEGGRIILDVNLNGRGPYAFAVDTASSISVIFEKLRRELNLESEPGVLVNVQGLTTAGSFPVVDLPDIQIGDRQWGGMRVALLPGNSAVDQGIYGLLGIDFLRQFGLAFTTDGRVLRLFEPPSLSGRTYAGWDSVPLASVVVGSSGAALYFFTVRIQEQSIFALLDLGSGLNLLNWPAGRELGLDPVRIRGKEALSGVTGDTPILVRLVAREIRTARVRWTNEEFSVADAGIFAAIPQGERPMAILGYGFLGQRDFIIDFARNRLLIRATAE